VSALARDEGTADDDAAALMVAMARGARRHAHGRAS
jgi:hypothetical protein